MKNFIAAVHRINTTVKIFVLCFAVYFICNISK